MASYSPSSSFASFFNPRFKTILHIVQLTLAVTILILGLVRLVTRPSTAPRTRTDTMALGMSAKSLVVLGYQVSTEHIACLRRFASLKAYLILNALEIVFWAAVAFMGIQSNVQSCIGTRCALGWVVVVLAGISSTFAMYGTGISYVAFRYSKLSKTEGRTSSFLSLNEHAAPKSQRDVQSHPVC